MFEQTQFDLLRRWIITATELPDVILAFPNAPRPDSDYGTLNLIRSARIGHPVDFAVETNNNYIDENSTEPPFFEVSVQEFEFTWTFHVYSNNPVNVMNRLVPWKTTQAGREILGPLNMFRMGEVKRLPEFIDQNWNDRATMELFTRSYVCTGTTNHGSGEVLLGRVPMDVAEFATVEFPTMRPLQTVNEMKQ